MGECMEKIYFFKPDEHNWDLETLEKGYLIKLHLHNNPHWQFGSLAIAEVLEVYHQDKKAKIKIVDKKGSDWDYVPKGQCDFVETPDSIYILPFDYFFVTDEGLHSDGVNQPL